MLDVPVWFSISGLSFPSLHLQSCLEWCPTWCRATVLVSIYYCGFCGSSVNPAISVAVCRPCQGFVLGPTFSSLISSWIKAVTPLGLQSLAILVLKPVCSPCCWTVSSQSSVPHQCCRCNLVVTFKLNFQNNTQGIQLWRASIWPVCPLETSWTPFKTQKHKTRTC